MAETVTVEGLAELEQALMELPRATERNVLIRTLTKAAQPIADTAARLAPERSGRLSYSIAVSTQLTRRARAPKQSAIEVYIGPAGGLGALQYAYFDEWGTFKMHAHPFMRPAWDQEREGALEIVKEELWNQIQAAAARLARKAARSAASG